MERSVSSKRSDVKGAGESYGVEILKADVNDLVFPCNLREIMNQVLETERKAEAKLIEARKEAETIRIRSEAEEAAELRRIRAEGKKALILSESKQKKRRLQLESELEEARAVQENPTLLKLKQLQVLKEMAQAGGRSQQSLTQTANSSRRSRRCRCGITNLFGSGSAGLGPRKEIVVPRSCKISALLQGAKRGA
jgi:regulator of protease activity HflC (stomatin/prohibitin superfamily)